MLERWPHRIACCSWLTSALEVVSVPSWAPEVHAARPVIVLAVGRAREAGQLDVPVAVHGEPRLVDLLAAGAGEGEPVGGQRRRRAGWSV